MEILFSGVIGFFCLFYIIGLLKKDFSIVDTAWGLSFFLIYLIGYFVAGEATGDGYELRVCLVGILTAVWALRLAGFIFYRSLRSGKEDYRYAQWRKDWGENANFIAFYRVYLLQAVLSIFMASPLYFIHQYPAAEVFPNYLDILGIILWVIGFAFEAISDWQKSNFRANKANKGKFITTGLWQYSRHPNYFGEAVLWWGIALMVLNHTPWYLAVLGPFVLNFFLLKVSGVALLEQKYEGNADYEQYKKRTNAFIPWLPKD